MVSSPCENVCTTENNKCTFCGRTIQEIIEWPDMTEEERKERMKELQKEENME